MGTYSQLFNNGKQATAHAPQPSPLPGEKVSGSPTTEHVPRVPSVRDVRDVLPVRPPKRVLKRHPFDIYADQLDSFKELKTRTMRQGEEASMSRMVREALDDYLKKQA